MPEHSDAFTAPENLPAAHSSHGTPALPAGHVLVDGSTTAAAQHRARDAGRSKPATSRDDAFAGTASPCTQDTSAHERVGIMKMAFVKRHSVGLRCVLWRPHASPSVPHSVSLSCE